MCVCKREREREREKEEVIERDRYLGKFKRERVIKRDIGVFVSVSVYVCM